MRNTLVAGVDSSTQSTKIVVCDAATGVVVRTARAPHPDATEVDPAAWWAAFEEASSGGILDGVSAIAVGGQQHGMVALDERGDVVRPALLWNDTRSADAAEALVAALGADRWVDSVGLVPVAAITAAKLRWMADHEPTNAEATRTVVLPHDWISGRILAGGGCPEEWATDRGDASGTGYFSARTGLYVPELQDLALGHPFATPRVLAPNQAMGRTPAGLLVGPGTGDNMAAALGLGLAPGDVVISLGTSGTVFAVTDTPSADRAGAIQGFADATGRHLPLMCTLNAARVLTTTATMLGVDLDSFADLAMQASPGAGGLTLLPYLDGERTPNLPGASGTLLGLTRANGTPANLARAAVEGMLANLVAGVSALAEQGTVARRVLLIGGAAASPAVRAVAASFFEVPVVVPAPGEYVALGAARQAAWVLSGEEEPPAWKIETDGVLEPTYDGSAALARYEELQQVLYGADGCTVGTCR